VKKLSTKSGVTLFIAAALGVGIGGIWGAKTEEEKGEVDKVTKLLETHHKLKGMVPPASNRAYWDKLADADKPEPKKAPPLNSPLVEGGEPRPTNPPPVWAKRECWQVLQDGIFQECAYGTGEWLPAIGKAINDLVDNPQWGTNTSDEEHLDLSSTRYGARIAITLAMLGDQLPKELVEKAKGAVRERIVTPWLMQMDVYQKERVDWGSKAGWMESPSNWNAACTAYIVYAALITEPAERAAEIIVKSEEHIENYLKTMEKDGYLDAGIRYWDFGFGAYSFLAETLFQATGGNLDLYEKKPVSELAVFPLRWRITSEGDKEQIYPMFGDNPIKHNVRPILIETLGRRFDIPEWGNTKVGVGDRNIDPELKMMLLALRKAELAKKQPGDSKKAFEKSGLFRESTSFRGSDIELKIVAKGGNNAEEHNHNDVGSYTIYGRKRPNAWRYLTGDRGAPAYTAENFGEERYLEPLNNSWGHPLPVIDGQTQREGAEARAEAQEKQEGSKVGIVYNITAAYNVPGLVWAYRTIWVDKEKGTISIEDEFKAERPMAFSTAVITEPFVAKETPAGLRISHEKEGWGATIFVKGSKPPKMTKGGTIFGKGAKAPEMTRERTWERWEFSLPKSKDGRIEVKAVGSKPTL
jgi:hypothetical protein